MSYKLVSGMQSLGGHQDVVDTNPTPEHWEWELLWGELPDFPTKTYAVRCQSKLAGNYEKSFLEVTFRKEWKEILFQLNVIGFLEEKRLPELTKHIKYLKSNGIFREVPSLLPYINPGMENEQISQASDWWHDRQYQNKVVNPIDVGENHE